jgi:molybdopterin-guanine dinucleotide biosynthesis protein A
MTLHQGIPVAPVANSSDVTGIILAGGRSSRMGRNKALLALPGESAPTFVERLTSLLAELCVELLLVVRDEQSGEEYASFPTETSRRLIYDDIPDQGPLRGLYSGLRAMTCEHALVLAVDLPFVRPALLAWLRAFPPTDELLVPLVGGLPQVLLARYPRALLPLVETCLQEGRRDPRALLERAPVRFLAEEEVRVVDPDLRSFININTPGDFQQAAQLSPGK